MNPTNSLRLPFLGAREDGEPFEYVLVDFDQECAHIAIFKWLVNCVQLDLQEKVDLFIPTILTPVYQFRKNTPGIITTVKMEEADQAYLYKVYFHHEISGALAVNGIEELAQKLLSESSLIDILIQLIKDSLILKQGILVYLKHLAPYFSRIVDYSHQDYQSLESFIFDDLKNRIGANEKSLNTLYNSLKEIKDPKDIALIINLEELRENIESEIILDLFLFAFANVDSRKELLALLKGSKDQNKLKLSYYYKNYLVIIKDLEKRLYSNYNQIVLIYIRSI